MDIYHIALFCAAAIVGVYGYVHYGREIPKKTLRPRAATWLIWGILSTVVAIIQLEHGAGLGVVGTVLGAVSGYVLAGMAWLYGHRRIHEADIASITLAVLTFVMWGMFGDRVAVVAASLIYLVGFAPTIVRATKAPRHERITPFATALFKHAASFMLLGSMSVETVAFPLVLASANGLFVIFLLLRR